MSANANENILIITSAFYHPSTELRKRLSTVLNKWVEQMKPRYSDEQIRHIINHEYGTPLEPFTLTKNDTDMAVLIARAAFSSNGGAYWFRVVSRETIGEQGGLVITHNLKHYYAERYVRGRYRRNLREGIAFFPAYVPSSMDYILAQFQHFQAIAMVDEYGINISINWFCGAIDRGLAARAFQKGCGPMELDSLGVE